MAMLIFLEMYCLRTNGSLETLMDDLSNDGIEDFGDPSVWDDWDKVLSKVIPND